MLAGDLVSDRFRGFALAREQRVQRLDAFRRTRGFGGAHELAEDLAAEQPVIFEVLIAALEYHRSGGFRWVRRRVGAKIETGEKVVPEIGHAASVSELSRIENTILVC